MVHIAIAECLCGFESDSEPVTVIHRRVAFKEVVRRTRIGLN